MFTRSADIRLIEDLIRKAASELPKHHEISLALQALERVERGAYSAPKLTYPLRLYRNSGGYGAPDKWEPESNGRFMSDDHYVECDGVTLTVAGVHSNGSYNDSHEEDVPVEAIRRLLADVDELAEEKAQPIPRVAEQD